MIDINLILKYFPSLMDGALTTLQIAGCACLIGVTLGTLLALAQTSKNKILTSIVYVYVTMIRGTPMLIQIAFFYYAILPALHIQLSALWAAIIAIGINSSAYISQVIRSGILSVGKGQREAAYTLGLSTAQSLRYIVLPQAIRVVIPSLGNEFITLIKDSSLAYTIGVVELYKQGITMRSQTFDTMTTFAAVALTYLVLTTGLSFIMEKVEKRMN
ncbi:MAG: amino acid ABC transporter permease [Candidatus Babeliales bacterium]|nr:amino acid ABC transporter permease [Candidatus Babeliales bacterium]